MAKIEVEVDVDITDFATWEIVDELCVRAKPNTVDIITGEHKAQLLIAIGTPTGNRGAISILDQMKIDFFMENMDRIELNDLEKLVK